MAPTRDPLPIEGLDIGLYLRQSQTPVTTINEGDSVRHYVPAEAFMALQKERDDYRRVTALINAWRLSEGRSERELERLLSQVGMSDGDARAMLGVIEWARSEPRP